MSASLGEVYASRVPKAVMELMFSGSCRARAPSRGVAAILLWVGGLGCFARCIGLSPQPP